MCSSKLMWMLTKMVDRGEGEESGEQRPPSARELGGQHSPRITVALTRIQNKTLSGHSCEDPTHSSSFKTNLKVRQECVL